MVIHLDESHGKGNYIRSILWADNFWVMPSSKEHLQQMVKYLLEEPEREDLESKPAKPHNSFKECMQKTHRAW